MSVAHFARTLCRPLLRGQSSVSACRPIAQQPPTWCSHNRALGYPATHAPLNNPTAAVKPRLLTTTSGAAKVECLLSDSKPEVKGAVQTDIAAPDIPFRVPVDATTNGAQPDTQASHTTTASTARQPSSVLSTVAPSIPMVADMPQSSLPTDNPIPVIAQVPPRPLWQHLGPLTWAANAYSRAHRRRPYMVQLCSSLVIALLADLSVQYMNRHQGPFDPLRTMRSLTIGGISGVPSYLWFVFLAQHFNYASRVLTIGVKVAINQAVYAPIFNSYFFVSQALLAGETLAEAWARVRRIVPISCVNSLKVWPAVMAINFAFVPLEFRPIFAGIIAVAWQTYLMYINRLAEDAQHTKLALQMPADGSDAIAPVVAAIVATDPARAALPTKA